MHDIIGESRSIPMCTRPLSSLLLLYYYYYNRSNRTMLYQHLLPTGIGMDHGKPVRTDVILFVILGLRQISMLAISA